MTNNEQITSLVITRRNAVLWSYVINEGATQATGACTGTGDGDYVTVKTFSGAPLALNVPFSVIEYYDANDSDNDLTDPANMLEVVGHFLEQGFFINFTEGGGGGSAATSFKSLTDVAVPTFIGNVGKFVKVINDNELGLSDAPGVPSLQQLANYVGGTFLPNKYILTTNTVDEFGNAVGFILGDINSIINRPPLFNEILVIRKGFTVVDGVVVPNTEPYAKEVGDYCSGFEVTEVGVYEIPSMRYDGGDETDLANYSQKAYKILRYAF